MRLRPYPTAFRGVVGRQRELEAIPVCRKPKHAPSGRCHPIGQMPPVRSQLRPAGFYVPQKSGCRNADKTSARDHCSKRTRSLLQQSERALSGRVREQKRPIRLTAGNPGNGTPER